MADHPAFLQVSPSKKQFPGTSTCILPLDRSWSGNTTRVETLGELKYVIIDKPPTFFDEFGALGFPLFLAASISFCWTVWLILLGINPNDSANYLMSTSEFDEGNFWLIAKSDTMIVVVNSIALCALALGYLYALLRMTLWRIVRHKINPVSPQQVEEDLRGPTKSSLFHLQRLKGKALWSELTGFDGGYRKYWNVFFKTGDFVVELIQLYRLMEAGFSADLCYGYAALLAMNSLSHTFFIFCPVTHTAFTEVLFDTMFDMIFAVGYPMILLEYSYTRFSMDRARARLYQEIFPPGSMQLQFRLYADPIETTLFRSCFDALRTISWTSLIVRVVMNISFCYRLLRVIVVIPQRRRSQRVTSSTLVRRKTQHPVPRWVGGIFMALSVAVVTYSVRSIAASQNACEVYPQCAVFAYRWNPGDVCPCIALVDVDRAPKTYEEWLNPVDVTDVVKHLAVSGDLQVLQLMNRKLEIWPQELRQCSNMQYMSLYYTGVQVIPPWAMYFRRLEILALQGKKGDTNIVSMPPDLFKEMSSLTYIRLGVHQHISELPSLEGLDDLESLSFALLTSVTSLPSLKPLTNLDRLELVAMSSLAELPDISSNLQLVHMVVTRAPVCCNGFLGICNGTNPLCPGITADQCFQEKERPGAESLAIFSTYSDVCAVNQSVLPVTAGPTQTQIEACSGVMYRQCQFLHSGTTITGICYNDHFQVIACSTSITVIYARKQEIVYHLGPPCDPVEEAWLGCV